MKQNLNQKKLIFLGLILLMSCSENSKPIVQNGEVIQPNEVRNASAPQNGIDLGPTESRNTEANTIYAVATEKAIKGDLKGYIRLNGDVESFSSVDIMPDTAGKITRLNVKLGDSVRKGQVIGYIDPSRPGIEFAQSPILAPVGGYITNIPVVVGTSVSPQTSLGKISPVREFKVTTYISERFVSKIALKQEAFLTFDAYPGQTFKASITEVSPVIDKTSRTQELSLKVTDPNIGLLKSGMYASIRLVVDNKKDVLKIRSTSVVSRYGKSLVFIVNPSAKGTQVEQREVSLGIKIDGQVEVLSGLNEGDIIVARGQSLLGDSTFVNIVEELPLLEPKANI